MTGSPVAEPGPAPRHQILADPTGRRRRRLAIAGRVATAVLGLWLTVVMLGGLGLQPLGGLPVVGRIAHAADAAPPALPERVQAAVSRRVPLPVVAQAAPVVAARRPMTSPSAITRAPTRHRGTGVRSRAKRRPPARATPPTTLRPVRPSPARAPAPAAATTPRPAASTPVAPPTSSRPTTSPSTTAPGQTKTAPGPPATTPGTAPTPGGKGRGHGTVSTP